MKIIRNIIFAVILAGGALTAYTKYTAAGTSSNILSSIIHDESLTDGISDGVSNEISKGISDSIVNGISDGISNGIKSAGEYAGNYISGNVAADDTPNYELTEENMFNDAYDIVSGDIAKCVIADMQSGMSIDIDLGGCSFQTAASEDDLFYIEASNIGKCQYYTEDGTLFLKGYGAESGVKNEIIFYIPKGYVFDTADIELAAGSVQIESIVAAELNLRCGAGVIGVEYAEADSINLKCSAGSINVRLFGVKEDYNYILESALGMVTIADESYSGAAQSQKLQNDSDKNVDINCTMGNIKIYF
jgi:hypothetical protein